MRKTLKVVAFGGGPADAFIKAAGITDSTQQTAIKTLVNDLNGYGLWSKMKAIYPMVGGNATAHSYNLKDTTKFQIAFSGGWTHSSNGALPNGTNGYGDTFLNPTNAFSVNNNVHLSYYSRTNSNGTEVEIGGANNSGGPYLMLEIRTSGTTYFIINEAISYTTASDSDSKAFYIGSRNGTTVKGYRNNLNVATRTGIAAEVRPNVNIYLGAANYNNVSAFPSTKQCAFATIGDGLTDAESSTLYTIIQNYQTILSRNI